MSVNMHDAYFHVPHMFSKEIGISDFYLSISIYCHGFFFFFLDSLNSKHAVSDRHCYSCQSDSPRLLCAVLDPVEDDGIAIRSCSGNPTRLAGNADLWNLVTNLWLDHKCHTQRVQSCLSEREIGFSLLDMQGIVTK